MKHTCDTARSGSERSENTCAACQDDRHRIADRFPPLDWTAEFERWTSSEAKSIGRKDAKTGGRS